MASTPYTPKTLTEAIKYFSNPDVAFEYMTKLRWPSGVACPHCGNMDLGFISTRKMWKCKGCKKQFSVKVGTLFEDSPLGLDKWLAAIWMITNAKNGVSSCEIARTVGVTQKTAWFMLQRIRLAMQTPTMEKLIGKVEVDETYIGGKARNMHHGKRKVFGRGTVGKQIVMGMLERGDKEADKPSQVRAKVVPDTKQETLQPEVKANVEAYSEVFTDSLPSYEGLDAEFAHQVVDHATEYVNGKVHINGMENFWTLFKRCMYGTYTHCEAWHLYRYLDEQVFRFNERKGKDGDRFRKVVGQVKGRRLTYKQVTGKMAVNP